MYYVKDVSMKDSLGQSVLGTGVVPTNKLFVVSAVARPGNMKWVKCRTGEIQTVAFGNVSIMGFRHDGKEPDKESYIIGEIGKELINSTPIYFKRWKNQKGEIGEVFYNSILNYSYSSFEKPNDKSKFFKISDLFGLEIRQAVDEAIILSAEILKKSWEPKTNAEISRIAVAFTDIIKKGESRPQYKRKEIEGEVKDISQTAIPQNQL
jgi:hypothetical protein